MLNYKNGFYSLMEQAGITTRDAFDSFLKDVVGANNSTALKLDGFLWEDRMQLDFDYNQMLVENRVGVMATYVDKDSDPIPLGVKGFELAGGSIPRQKSSYIMDEDDYRKYLIIVAELSATGGNAKTYAEDVLFNKLSDLQETHNNSMTYQRDSMVSRAMLSLLNTNNPNGLQSISFEAGVPAENITTLKTTYRWFTDAAKLVVGADSDPVGDMKTFVRAAKSKGMYNFHLEADEQSFYQDMSHPKWTEALGRATNSMIPYTDDGVLIAKGFGQGMFDDEIKRTFERIIGAEIVLSKSMVAVETWDNTLKKLTRPTLRSFEPNTYVIVPNGNIGTIKTVMPLSPDPTGIAGSIFDNKGLIKYSYDIKTSVQEWWSELTSLCVPNQSLNMYYLKTK